MLKKIIIGIVITAVLIGVENLAAREKGGNPKVRQKQQQVQKQKRPAGQKQRAVQRRPATQKAQAKRKGQAKKTHGEKAIKKAAHKRMGRMPQMHQGLRPGANQTIHEEFNRCFDELIKAYRQNDREKMGQLLRKMNQTRQRLQKARDTFGERGRGFRDRAGTGRRPLRGGLGMRGRRFQGRGMGRGGYGFQGRGMGRGFQDRDIGGRWRRGSQRRGMGGHGGGVRPRRGINARRRGINARRQGMPAGALDW